MKRMLFLGALALSVTFCSQSYGFEILKGMLGHKGCTSCTEPACDAGNGCADACEPGCGGNGGCLGGRKGCFGGNGCSEPACDAGNGCCEPACGAGNGCTEPSCGAVGGCGKKKHNLFGGLKGLFDGCKRKNVGCTSCCEPACGAGNGCAEPACGAGNGCAEPACGAGNGCCEPSCGSVVKMKKSRGTPILDMLRSIHSSKKRHHGCTSCCDADPGCGAEPDCAGGNGCCEPACGAVSSVAPAVAPTPDASAAKKTTGKVVAVSRTVSTK